MRGQNCPKIEIPRTGRSHFPGEMPDGPFAVHSHFGRIFCEKSLGFDSPGNGPMRQRSIGNWRRARWRCSWLSLGSKWPESLFSWKTFWSFRAFWQARFPRESSQKPGNLARKSVCQRPADGLFYEDSRHGGLPPFASLMVLGEAFPMDSE